MQSVATYQEYINNELEKRLLQSQYSKPKGLYEPCAFILKNGGKRVRASLVLMAAKMFSNDYTKALPVSLAFETFHNFTLIHDDIMDDADIRRGQPTVHVKWDVNTGILSGDAVMIMAYKFFEEATDYISVLFSLLNTTALEVCEGQQYDIDLERASLTESWVTEEMYVKMIELKTSVLIAACLKAGALVGGATQTDANKLYEIGRLIGIGFQLQDDLLDSFGDEKTFGKKIGGDIDENKKTFLVIKALELLEENDKKSLLELYSSKDTAQKYDKVIALFNKANVKEIAEKQVDSYFEKAITILNTIELSVETKKEITLFIDELHKRAF